MGFTGIHGVKHLCLGVAIALGWSMSIGCTRAIEPKESVRLVIPFNGSNSSFAVGDSLEYAAINITNPATPGKVYAAKQFDFWHNPIPWGTPITLTVGGLASGSGFLIQFMGVFKTAAGGSYLITYGDSITNIGVGTTTVNILAAPAGTATKEGRVSGRYFMNDSGEGPTGNVKAFFHPPLPPDGIPRPRMEVENLKMVAGYFDFFVLDTIPLTFELVEGSTSGAPVGITIFGGLTIGHPALAPAAHVLQMSEPNAYEKRFDDGVSSVEAAMGGDYYLGYFKSPTVSAGVFSGKNVYYVSAHQEGLLGRYAAYNSGTGVLSQPIIYNDAGSAGDLRRVGGGSGIAYNALYLGASCDPSVNSCLNFFHNRVSGGDDGFSGIKPPFSVMDPHKRWGGFLRQKFDGTSQIFLDWKYLYGAQPGQAGSGFSGVDILYKLQNGGSSSDDDKTCLEFLTQEGYSLHGSLTGAVTTTNGAYTISGASSSTYYQYQVLVCPFMMDGTTKKYVGNFIRSDCSGSCGDFDHFGWGVTDLTVSTPGSAVTALGIKHGKVSGINTASPAYTQVSVAGFSTADIGKEVLFTVVGQRNGSDCGMGIQVGQKNFARILDASGSMLKVPKATFMDYLNPGGLSLPLSTSGACLVQATLVPHFKNLTINATITMDPYNYLIPGGILAVRTSGMLSIAGGMTISAAGAGYPGGGAANADGGGHSNEPGFMAYVSQNSGGQVTVQAGGGGGPTADGGWGMDGGAFAVGQAGRAVIQGGGGGDWAFAMGGGGAGYGGSGGGIIFLGARNMAFGSGSGLFAYGLDQSAPPGAGGGGGTIFLMAEKVSGSPVIDATGGSGTASAPGDGGGGGGMIVKMLCNLGALTIPANAIDPGAGPNHTDGSKHPMPGQIMSSSSNPGDWNPACN